MSYRIEFKELAKDQLKRHKKSRQYGLAREN